MSDEVLTRWLQSVDVDNEAIEIAIVMGVTKPSEFALFSFDELCQVYGFSAVSARKILRGIDALQVDKSEAVHQECIAIYSFAAIRPMHLNARIGQRFQVLNSSFNWWLCRNADGESGILPSNHLNMVANSSPDNTSEREVEVLPTWQIRSRIKQICDQALSDADTHFLTYMSIKRTLIDECGEDLFAAEKEHVKEMIRRTEQRLRRKHDDLRTNKDAANAIKAAKKRNIRAKYDKHRASLRGRTGAERAGGGGAPVAAMDADTAADDTLPPTPPPRPSLMHAQPNRAARPLPALPPPSMHAPPQGSARASDAAGGDGGGKYQLPRLHALVASPPLSPSAAAPEPQAEDHGEDMGACSWKGAWFRKKALVAQQFGFTSEGVAERRWLQPYAAGLLYYTDDTRAELRARIALVRGKSNAVVFPPHRPHVVVFQSLAKGRVIDLVAEDPAEFARMAQYVVAQHAVGEAACPLFRHLRLGSDVTIQHPIGSGEFGAVYLAELCAPPKDKVVVKALLPTSACAITGSAMLDVLKQELRDMATLRHKNVLRVLGYGVFDAEPCVVSDFAALFGLRSMVLGGEAMTWEKRLEIVSEIAAGMCFLHEHYSFPHFGLHGNNVLLTDALQVKIADYGMHYLRSALAGGNGVQKSAAATKMVPRKPAEGSAEGGDIATDACLDDDDEMTFAVPRRVQELMASATEPPSPTAAPVRSAQLSSIAPEIWLGGAVTLSADVYSFGIVCWELMTRVAAWSHLPDALSVGQALRVEHRPPLPRECPGNIARLIYDCWAQTPQTRPSFAQILESR